MNNNQSSKTLFLLIISLIVGQLIASRTQAGLRNQSQALQQKLYFPAVMQGSSLATPPVSKPTEAACGPMAQEAESGTLFGNMKSIGDGQASGGRAIGSDVSFSNISINDRVDFCVNIAESGAYQVIGYVKAPNDGSNSMFWTFGGTSQTNLWHMTISDAYVQQFASAGGSFSGGNAAKTVTLEKGNHTLSFYLRESNVMLDRIEVVVAVADGVPIGVPEAPPPHEPGQLSQLVTSKTHTDYSNAGLTNGIPSYSNVVHVTGRSESDIETAIRNAQPYTKIILPAGVINIGTIDINKSNIILAGSGNGCGETILRFGSNDTGINIGRGGHTGSSVNLTANAGRSSREIVVSNSSQFNSGDYILIRQNDNSDYFRADLSRNSGEDWTRNNATQINKVIDKRGNTLVLEGGLNLEYKTSLNARVAKINNMITGVGIENLTLERTSSDYAAYESSNIYFKYAANSWVKGVHSKKAIRSHVTFNKGYKSEVRGMYLDAAFNNGSGGHGYGVRLEGSTTDVLVENNIAKLMRHSFIAQVGANGNVFGYNYSADSYGEGFGEIYSDLSVHGGFGHSNLFEGNQAQNAKIDNIHASNSSNLFFRNRLEQDIDNYTYRDQLMSKGASTPHIWVHENQYYNAFLANEISFPGANRNTQTVGFDGGRVRDNFTVCKYETSGDGERGCGRTRSTTINHGTYDHLTNQTTWDSSISKRGFPNSVYLGGKPSFWGSSAWPSFGPDTLGLSESEKMIPAKSRFLNAQNGGGSFCYTGG